MSGLWPGRLRALALAVGAATLLVGVDLAGVGWAASRAQLADDRHGSDQEALARSAAAAIAGWMAHARADAAGMAASLEPWRGVSSETASSSAALDRLVSVSGVFDQGAIVLDSDLRVVGASRIHRALVGLDRGHLQARQAAVEDRPIISDLMAEPLEHLQAVAVAAPVHDASGRVVAVVEGFSRVPGGTLWSRISQAAEAIGAPVVVATPSGVMLDGRPGPWIGTEHVGPQLAVPAKLGAEAAGRRTYAGEAGTPSVASYAPVGGGWAVVVPEDAGDLGAGRASTVTALQAVLVPSLLGVWLLLLVVEARRRRTARSVEASKRTFLAIAGHELRTPLALVKGFAHALAARWDSLEPSARHEMVTRIDRQVRNLEHVVDRVLLSAELDAGIRVPVSGPALSPLDVVRAVVDHQRALSPLRLIEVGGVDVEVAIDRRVLEAVVTQLVENAVRYSPEASSVTVEVIARKRRVRVVVEDEGVGLPRDPDHLFEKFVQHEDVATRTLDEGGLGLGLFVVRSLAELAGGRAWAEPRQPRGARFVLELPRGPKARATRTSRPARVARAVSV